MIGGSLHLERSPHPNFDMASGHERPGATYNEVYIEGYWCLICGRPDFEDLAAL